MIEEAAVVEVKELKIRRKFSRVYPDCRQGEAGASKRPLIHELTEASEVHQG